MFLWIYSVLEQISNDQFHLPDKDLFPMLCIGWYNCALKWLDVDYFLIIFFCNWSFGLYETTVQP